MQARSPCLYALAFASFGAFAPAAELPSRRAAAQPSVKNCAAHGAGFVWVAALNSCVKTGGSVGVEYSVSPRAGRK